MDRNTTIAFILIGAILVLWFYMNSPTPEKMEKGKQVDTTMVQKDTSLQKQKADTSRIKKSANKETAIDSTEYGKYFTTSKEKEQLITVENDLSVLVLSTKGANIQKYFLKKFKNWYSANTGEDQNFYNSHVQLIDYSKGNAYNLSFVTSDGKAINTGDLVFNSDATNYHYTLADNDSLVMNFRLPSLNNSYIEKKYTFYGHKYSFQSEITLVNMSNLISNNSYDLVWSNGLRFVEDNSVDEANYSDASVYYGGEQVIVDASSVGENVNKDFNGRIDWVAVRDKYFASIIAPKDPGSVNGAYIEGSRVSVGKDGVKENYSLRINVPFKNGAVEKNYFTVYIGPVDYDLLKEYGEKFTALVDFGSFFGLKFIVRPIAEYILLPLFNFLHTFIPNYGFVIVIFSLIIKFVLYPLTKSSFQSMKKMQLLQPKIAEIKEKYKDDPQKLNKETMKLYQTYGVNPAGGCLPLLLQMPIFIALWGLFKTAIELRQQPFILWIKDLSIPDIIYQLPFKLPLFGIDQISGLAILMGVTTFVQQKMSVKDPKQAGLVYLMPIFLTIMFMSFPSGLNLYYFMFNIFSIAQQYYINHKHDGMVLEPVKNPNKKKGFMSKLMEAAEQNAKVQQQKKRR
ncbi:MAG TPA: membrane protein insertase YidC [Ignavibacteriaceae bacterium]|nr:membrane protein insertase YidC [Ignavibacteriaceae bacterium]